MWSASHFFPLLLSDRWPRSHFSLSVLSPSWWLCIWGKTTWFLSPLCLRYPASFLCLHLTDSFILSCNTIPSAVELVFNFLETLPWIVCHSLPLKWFLFLFSNNDKVNDTQCSHPMEITLKKTPKKNALKEVHFFSF